METSMYETKRDFVKQEELRRLRRSLQTNDLGFVQYLALSQVDFHEVCGVVFLLDAVSLPNPIRRVFLPQQVWEDSVPIFKSCLERRATDEGCIQLFAITMTGDVCSFIISKTDLERVFNDYRNSKVYDTSKAEV